MDEHEIQKLAPSTALANLERIRIPRLVGWSVGLLILIFSLFHLLSLIHSRIWPKLIGRFVRLYARVT